MGYIFNVSNHVYFRTKALLAASCYYIQHYNYNRTGSSNLFVLQNMKFDIHWLFFAMNINAFFWLIINFC